MSNPRITDSSPAAQFLAREFPVQSPLIARLQQFIPELSKANEQLQNEDQKPNIGISIEHVAMNANGEEESSANSSSDEESDSEQTSNSMSEEGPHVQFDLHVIGSGTEDEDNSTTDDEQTKQADIPKGKKKLIEEID
ncbi:hypothetical protein M3Y97_00456800 [Aphelenchoides bicaudatus]|nr:hypothetical protein M3Y97_00456800 [Aphelenchoides bicaudatus]